MRKLLILLTLSVIMFSCKKDESPKPETENYIVYIVTKGDVPTAFYSNGNDASKFKDGYITAIVNMEGSGPGELIVSVRDDGEYWTKIEDNKGYAYIKILDGDPVRLQVFVNDKVIYDETKKNNFFERELTKDDFLP